MKRIKKFWGNFEANLAAAFSMLMVVVMLIQVISRFVFNNAVSFSEEVASLSFVMSIYTGAIAATRNNEHLRMEVVVDMFKHNRGKPILLFISNIAFMVANVFLTYGLIIITQNLYKRGMATAMLGLPKWIPYAVLPVCFFFITLRLIQDCIDKVRIIRDFDKNKPADQGAGGTADSSAEPEE